MAPKSEALGHSQATTGKTIHQKLSLLPPPHRLPASPPPASWLPPLWKQQNICRCARRDLFGKHNAPEHLLSVSTWKSRHHRSLSSARASV